MGVAREYTAAQALAILNASEGLIVRDRMRRAPLADESPAHAFGRHLMHGGHYGKGSGYAPMTHAAGEAGIRDRYLGAPENISSGWYRKGDMAIRLVEVLNSAIGQEALRTLDRGARRVSIHYLNRAVMKVATAKGNLFDPGHASASYDVKPASSKLVPEDIYNKKTGEFIKRLYKPVVTPKTVTAVLDEKRVVGIHAVLDRFGADSLHVQTLFPSLDLDLECFDYEMGVVKFLVFVNSKGAFEARMTPKA